MSPQKTEPDHDRLSFDDTEIAFRNKSDGDLNSAYWLFKVLNSNFLTTILPPITKFSLQVGLPIKPMIKRTVFKQFCGGETIAECEGVIKQLALGKVGTILDYAVEGEEQEDVFEEAADQIIETVNRAKGDPRIPLTVFKPTGVARFALLEKITAKEALSEAEREEFGKLEVRVDKICAAAFNSGVPVMIDAEESWIQDAIDSLALKMMEKYNRSAVIVCNTYQLYRVNMLETLKKHARYAQQNGFKFGAKLVRGAYMEKERIRAGEIGYPSPIQPDKKATDDAYNAALAYCVEQIGQIKLIAGTHNENSCRTLVDLIYDHGIARNHNHIYFSQLLGMGDNLSYNLADAGYNAVKYVPYGPVKKVLPYLFRRAEENTAITGQTGRELGLIIKERRRRLRG